MGTRLIQLVLDEIKDADLCRWLDRQPKRRRSAAIREALRAYLTQQEVTLIDIYQVVQELKEKGVSPPAVTNTVMHQVEEDPEIADNLDHLLGL